MEKIGILGAGAMGSGIAQVAAAAGHEVIIFDANAVAMTRSARNIQENLKKLVDKGKMTDSDSYALFSRIKYGDSTSALGHSDLVI